MFHYLVRRLLVSVPILFGVLIVVFLIMHLSPGDPAQLMAGEQAPPHVVEEIRRQLGLDQPVYVQLFQYVQRVLEGDLGRSIRSKRPVWDEIIGPFRVTFQLVVTSTVLSTLIAVPAGVVAAVYRGKLVDKLTMILMLAGYSFPSFWIGLLLMYFLGFRLSWLPISGWEGPTSWHGVLQMVMPVMTLVTIQGAAIARLTRSCTLEVLGQDYIRTARAKGLIERVVVMRHALRNASLPVVTIIALQFGFFLGGSVVIENVFAVPGMGRLIVEAVRFRDFPVVQGAILFFAVGFVLINIAADLLYQVLDPRIRYE